MARPDLEAIRARLDAYAVIPQALDTDGDEAAASSIEAADASIALHAHAPDDLAALLAYIADLESIAREVATNDDDMACDLSSGMGGGYACIFGCDFTETDANERYSPIQHAPDCPVSRSRALAIPPAKEASDG